MYVPIFWEFYKPGDQEHSPGRCKQLHALHGPERLNFRKRTQSGCMDFVLPCKPNALVIGRHENVSEIELAVMAS